MKRSVARSPNSNHTTASVACERRGESGAIAMTWLRYATNANQATLSGSRLAILTYHAIGDPPSAVTITPATFAAQIRALAEAGWSALTLPQVVELLQRGKRFPRRAVALTFDDGFRSTATIALPVLRAYGFVATVFPVVNYLGRDNAWPGQWPNLPTLPLLGWPDLELLAAAGWAIGAHTLTHPNLTSLAVQQAGEEIVASGDALRRLGVPVETFAYPYGAYTPLSRAIVARHYHAACGTSLAFARRDSDRFALPRLDAYYLRPAALVRWLDSPWPAAYLRFRRLARMVRRQPASTTTNMRPSSRPR